MSERIIRIDAAEDEIYPDRKTSALQILAQVTLGRK